ncbi:hypothetical protein [Pseudodesulfovibrio senegalensis]|uniref:Uncharacterized protein n=1 Tax=Pseudodesulfovibrio senegalensis TaxID=1721087 RepID=A0A6N6N3M4_9BACT|nr:hypothetical protein [Pseudodesulfovibrio senegalensis]KAB1442782.1 hypothetical protein F8A88_00455 [Pseudodesulfovibrio senegalensis]
MMQIQAHAADLYGRIQAVQPPRSVSGAGGGAREQAEARAQGDDSGPRAAGARMTTRTMGFSLGSFGVEYSSSSLQLDESLSPEAASERRTAQSFSVEAEVETLRSLVAGQAVATRSSLSGLPYGASRGSMSFMQAGLAAYSRAASPELPAPGSMFASLA